MSESYVRLSCDSFDSFLFFTLTLFAFLSFLESFLLELTSSFHALCLARFRLPLQFACVFSYSVFNVRILRPNVLSLSLATVGVGGFPPVSYTIYGFRVDNFLIFNKTFVFR